MHKSMGIGKWVTGGVMTQEVRILADKTSGFLKSYFPKRRKLKVNVIES